MNLAVGGNSMVSQSLYGGGFTLGKFFNDHSTFIGNALQVLLILAVVGLIVMLIINTNADMTAVTADASLIGATSAYMSIMYHQRCKQRGGCGRDCPFISEDDPRVIIHKQRDNIDRMYDQTQQGIQEDQMMVNNALEQLADDPSKAGLTSSWTSALAIASDANQAIGVILGQLKDLDKIYGEVEVIDVALVNAKNKATALGAAAVIQKNILVVASLHLNAQIMIQYIKNVPSSKQSKVIGYDQLSTISIISAKSISDLYAANNSVPATYASAYGGVAPSTASSSQDIVASMATLLSLAYSSDAVVGVIVSKLADVSEAYQACRYVIDRFSNDMPGTMDSDKVTSLIQAGDYENAIIQTALEPDLVSNHKKFAKERSSFESGGGIQSVRDDDNDINPWVGIFGRPTYRKSNGSSVDISTGVSDNSDGLKSIPSDKPSDLMRSSAMRLGTVVYPKSAVPLRT